MAAKGQLAAGDFAVQRRVEAAGPPEQSFLQRREKHAWVLSLQAARLRVMASSRPPHQGVVLAAGEGRRLRPLTATLPKALVPFHGRPLLDHAVAHLVRAGVTRIAVNACYLADQVEGHVREVLAAAHPDVAFHVSREAALLGTGGALKQLAPWFDDAPFWIANADNVYAEPLRELWAHHVACAAAGTLLVTRDPAFATMRRLMRDPRGFLTGLREPYDPAGAVFCGVQLAEPSLVARLPDGPSCNLRQGYLPFLSSGLRIATWETRRFWADTGTPERLTDAVERARAVLAEVLAR
jgi:MurNAc alpha-1-phosphate uridylyltransferase